MTLIRNRNRLLRLAGVMLLTAALALIPAAAFAADGSQDGSATARSPLLPPTAVDNLAGSFNDDNTRGQVPLSWEDSQTAINPLCYGPTFFICLWAAFFGYSAATIDAPTEYVVERRQLPQQGRTNGYPINGAHDWTEIARVSGANGALPAMGHTDPQTGTPSRTMDYRVKACNDMGCSGWSETVSVYIRYPWCASQPNLCD